jgi:hypothetical protein
VAPDTAAADAAALLRKPASVRARAEWALARAIAGESPSFRLDPSRLDAATDAVVAATRARYPSLAIPFHSRWRHVEAGGVDRRAALEAALGERLGRPATARERARLHVDLAVASVLLDAGAGPGWRYAEPASGAAHTRSEGLAVASVDAFAAGLFSSDPAMPLRVDAAGLRALDAARLGRAFQVGSENPLAGLDGRAALLRRLGDALAAHPDVYGAEGRPGGLVDRHAPEGTAAVALPDVLETLLATLAPAWPSGNAVGGVPLGDCWPLDGVPGPGASAGWMPFHKLSQWLAYSLAEPFVWAGVRVDGVEALTGLPEYRNGGLFLDTGVLALRDPGAAGRPLAVGDPVVVEWRALTVALLDRVAARVRTALGVDLPLACVLEGGTWAAGRALAQRLRAGAPPLAIASDGTVF